MISVLYNFVTTGFGVIYNAFYPHHNIESDVPLGELVLGGLPVMYRETRKGITP